MLPTNSHAVLLIATTLLGACAHNVAATQAPQVVTIEEAGCEYAGVPHRFIQNWFKIEGRLYKATGFLREKEEAISYDELVARNPGPLATEEEGVHLKVHQMQMPPGLRQFNLAIKTEALVTRWGQEMKRPMMYFGWDEESKRWYKVALPGDMVYYDCSVLLLHRVE